MAGYKWYPDPGDAWFIESRTTPPIAPILEEQGPKLSGLLDANGKALVHEKPPMGFALAKKE